jgi:hypothetical protein
MIKFIKNIKNVKFYYYFLKYLFIPFYDLLWTYFINSKDKLLGIIFNFSTSDQSYLSMDNNSKKIIEDNSELKKLSLEILDSINPLFLKKQINKITSEEYKEKLENEAIKNNPYLINIFPFLDLNIKKKIINFAVSNFMLKTAYNYLGVFPILARIYLNLNIPTYKKKSASQLWHRDDFGYKNLDLFMAINEIDEDNGPLYTIKKKDPLNVFFRVKKEVNSGLKGERGKILDQNFVYLDSNKKENLSVLKGKPGTTMLIDSIRNYHKGGYCESNYRLMLRINYMTNDSTFPIKDLENNRQTWLDLVETKSFFKKYSLRKKGLIFEKLRIPKILFSFYHAISIKK